MSTLDLFGEKPFRFDGDCGLELLTDHVRLTEALKKVKALLSDGRKHTIPEIAAVAGCSENGASARCRDLRKAQFGSHDIRRERVPGGNGLHVYWWAQ